MIHTILQHYITSPKILPGRWKTFTEFKHLFYKQLDDVYLRVDQMMLSQSLYWGNLFGFRQTDLVFDEFLENDRIQAQIEGIDVTEKLY